jgi:hypothetical protein
VFHSLGVDQTIVFYINKQLKSTSGSVKETKENNCPKRIWSCCGRRQVDVLLFVQISNPLQTYKGCKCVVLVLILRSG